MVWVGSVSKSLSTAYRVGWFCIGGQLKAMYPEFYSANVSVNTPLQLGLADFIYSREYRNHLSRLQPQLMQQVEQYRRYILKAFAPLNIGLSQPQGAMPCGWNFLKRLIVWLCIWQPNSIRLILYRAWYLERMSVISTLYG